MKLKWNVSVEQAKEQAKRAPFRWGRITLRPGGTVSMHHKIDIDYNFVQYGGRKGFTRFVQDRARKVAEELWDSIDLADE